VDEKLKGRAKEAVGALTGDEDKKAEGRAEQKKAEAAEEAAKKAKRRQEAGDQGQRALGHRRGYLAEALGWGTRYGTCAFVSL
jgi:uncharacterized protein YjbJ (UPF0337 family)